MPCVNRTHFGTKLLRYNGPLNLEQYLYMINNTYNAYTFLIWKWNFFNVTWLLFVTWLFISGVISVPLFATGNLLCQFDRVSSDLSVFC